MKIEDLFNCTGCSACFSVCTKAAIKMIPNKEGFLFPVIDKNSCINCGLCDKTCPLLNQVEVNNKTSAFAVVNKNEEVRYSSSSGGAFFALAEKILNEKGIVFGASVSDDLVVKHIKIKNIEDLWKLQGSKYVQSSIENTYKECKEFLLAGKTVLYSGTPCQIAGLKTFLKKEYQTLYTIDIICHGVPSPLLWKKYKESMEVKENAKIIDVSFRDKSNGWNNYSLHCLFDNNKQYIKNKGSDKYLKLFIKNVALRNSCYSCKYKTIERCSDLTLGDFWGINKEMPELSDDKGVTFAVVHSEKGLNLLTSVQNCLIEDVQVNSGVKYNPAMIKSVMRPKQRTCFFNDLENKRFETVINQYSKTVAYKIFINKLKRYAKRILNK